MSSPAEKSISMRNLTPKKTTDDPLIFFRITACFHFLSSVKDMGIGVVIEIDRLAIESHLDDLKKSQCQMSI